MPKLTVDFSERVNDLLGGLAARNEITKTDVLRRAIALFDMIDRSITHDTVSAGSRWLAIVDENNKAVYRIVLT